MKRNVSVVRPIVATRSSGPPASQPVIKEMPGSVASGTPCTKQNVPKGADFRAFKIKLNLKPLTVLIKVLINNHAQIARR